MTTPAASVPPLRFLKMHGLGNDFVIIDARGAHDPVTPALARALGDRHIGVGFDQLAVIHDDAEADARLTFWNTDGSLSGACGNATRCIARLMMDQSGATRLALRTDFDTLLAEDAGNRLTRVNMGRPVFDWRRIPLARDVDTVNLPLPGAPGALSMGNPHCVFITEDAEAADIAAQGARFEHDPLYPERTNVEMVQVLAPDRLRLRIWERGVGITLASGSCACAALVACHRKGLSGRKAEIIVDGGTLHGEWREDGVWLTGPTATVFEATLSPEMWP
ncbi:diaminopimelate epimerase [Oceanibium sediminis]|uniref:diaminopimelate epimerase n=1 Tax=Oceanibium sediminis TaxID=2026339 RepID=UPI000DD32732|nr:diaminopimelate epimerase [Oceanibium sediminis]